MGLAKLFVGVIAVLGFYFLGRIITYEDKSALFVDRFNAEQIFENKEGGYQSVGGYYSELFQEAIINRSSEVLLELSFESGIPYEKICVSSSGYIIVDDKRIDVDQEDVERLFMGIHSNGCLVMTTSDLFYKELLYNDGGMTFDGSIRPLVIFNSYLGGSPIGVLHIRGVDHKAELERPFKDYINIHNSIDAVLDFVQSKGISPNSTTLPIK